MKRHLLSFIFLLFIGSFYANAAEQIPEEWPKGINPATLLQNEDEEPNLSGRGFVELFNGTDLSGWNVKGGKMIFEAKDGVIVGKNVKGQPNGFLCTDKDYNDFIFTAEFKWEVLGNSGIMFRASAKDQKGKERVFGYQSEMDQNKRRWTGGIYGEAMDGWKYPLSKTEGHLAARAAIEDHFKWNRMTIYAKGNVLKTWINGVPCSHLVNNERVEGFFGLQVHAGREGTILWKNIRIKELQHDTSWTNLFEKDDFSQWSKVKGAAVSKGWSVKDGVVHRYGEKAGGIVTKKKFKDFELIFDWKISEGGNSGVKYRTHGNLGLEYQVLDDHRHKAGKNPAHRSGSLYDLLAAPDSKIIQPVGKWNTARIIVDGKHIEHWLNGVKLLEIKYGSQEWNARFQKSKYSKYKGFGSWEGPILLQDHHDPVWFRNVRIREL